jgi:hypothetical protein
MTTLNPATRLSSPELAVTRVGPQIRVRLPAGGWQVGFRAQHDGRTVIEVTGQDGSLAGLVASSRLPGPAVRHLYPQAARRARRRGAARRRGRALGHCRRAVGRRRRRALHGGPLRRRSGNADTAPEAGHGAAGTVMTRGGRDRSLAQAAHARCHRRRSARLPPHVPGRSRLKRTSTYTASSKRAASVRAVSSLAGRLGQRLRRAMSPARTERSFRPGPCASSARRSRYILAVERVRPGRPQAAGTCPNASGFKAERLSAGSVSGCAV